MARSNAIPQPPSDSNLPEATAETAAAAEKAVPPVAAKTETKKSEKQWAVYDSNALPGKSRAHDVVLSIRGDKVITKTYQLFSDEDQPCFMPRDHAMRFLKDKAFLVYDEDRELVEPIETKKETDVNVVLPSDEIIAKIEELSDVALFRRCKLLPNSEGIQEEKSSRDDMMDFIEAANKAARRVGTARGSEGVIPQMSDAEIAALGI